MSWGEIFFGFHGRIKRRTYWVGSFVLTLTGLLFCALLTYLATGNPFAPEVWQRPADKSLIWTPVWLAYFLFIAWPSAALAIKRLHDRGRPSWIWYAYFVMTFVFSLMPLRSTADTPHSSTAVALSSLTLIVGGYLFSSLAFYEARPGGTHMGKPIPSRVLRWRLPAFGAGCLHSKGGFGANGGSVFFC